MVEVNYTAVAGASILNTSDAYTGAYDTFRLELRPAQGAVLAVERTIPTVNTAIMTLE